jgi:hypothetical protein
MISAAAESRTGERTNVPDRKRPRVRPGLIVAVLLVFIAQVAVMFLLGNPPAASPARPTAPAPAFFLGPNQWDELLALQDPTIFMLPHDNNFSGPAWMKIPQQTFDSTNWTEPARPLELPPERLGSGFAAFMETNPPPRFQMDIGAGPGVNPMPAEPMPLVPISVSSTVRVEGDLAKRRLLTSPQLSPQTNADFDVLQNTEVQLLVDAQGNAFSPVVLTSSKNSAADAVALDFARKARFGPLKTAPGTAPSATMTFGKLIFEWQTLPPAPTNAPPSKP